MNIEGLVKAIKGELHPTRAEWALQVFHPVAKRSVTLREACHVSGSGIEVLTELQRDILRRLYRLDEGYPFSSLAEVCTQLGLSKRGCCDEVIEAFIALERRARENLAKGEGA